MMKSVGVQSRHLLRRKSGINLKKVFNFSIASQVINFCHKQAQFVCQKRKSESRKDIMTLLELLFGRKSLKLMMRSVGVQSRPLLRRKCGINFKKVFNFYIASQVINFCHKQAQFVCQQRKCGSIKDLMALPKL